MDIFVMLVIAMVGLISGEKVPEDFLSLVSSSQILQNMKKDVSEESLIKNITARAPDARPLAPARKTRRVREPRDSLDWTGTSRSP